MGPKIVINNKEVTNPIAKVLISLAAFVFSVLMALLVVFIILPFVGVVVVGTFGMVITILVSLLFGIPILLLIGTIITLIAAPFRRKE